MTQPYANSLYEQAMNEPIGTAYSAPVPDCDTTYGLLVSGWFYVGGAFCIALASGLFWLAYRAWWIT